MKKAFVNALPKSGTNLLAKCLLLFGYRERGHISAGVILDRRIANLFRRLTWGAKTGGYVVGIFTPVGMKRRPIDSCLLRVRNGEFITGHVGYSQEILQKILGIDIAPIQVIRDPRAILASFVPYVLSDNRHFLNKIFKSVSKNERYKMAYDGFVQSGLVHRSLRDSCLSIDPWMESKDVCVVKYEEIVGGQGGGSDVERVEALQRVARFLSIPEERIASVEKNLYGPGRHTFRKGKIDSWKAELPRLLSERISIEMEDVIKKWGYSI